MAPESVDAGCVAAGRGDIAKRQKLSRDVNTQALLYAGVIGLAR